MERIAKVRLVVPGFIAPICTDMEFDLEVVDGMDRARGIDREDIGIVGVRREAAEPDHFQRVEFGRGIALDGELRTARSMIAMTEPSCSLVL